MRVSIDEALSRGYISEDAAKQMRKASVTKRSVHKQSSDAAVAGQTARRSSRHSDDVDNPNSPQWKIYNALNARSPGIAMWEVGGLVPGRQYRVDIYLPESRLVIEMDGFGPHRSKASFQADRDRRNLLVAMGYPVIAYYYARVQNDLNGIVSEVMRCHDVYKQVMPKLFEITLVDQVVHECADLRDRELCLNWAPNLFKG